MTIHFYCDCLRKAVRGKSRADVKIEQKYALNFRKSNEDPFISVKGIKTKTTTLHTDIALEFSFSHDDVSVSDVIFRAKMFISRACFHQVNSQPRQSISVYVDWNYIMFKS